MEQACERNNSVLVARNLAKLRCTVFDTVLFSLHFQLQGPIFVAEVNATEADKTKEPSLISRSVAVLKLELAESQIASTAKLRKEFQKRSDDNSMACDVLHNHQHLWASVGGPLVESLFRPSAGDIEQAQQCCDTLQKMIEGDDPDAISDH